MKNKKILSAPELGSRKISAQVICFIMVKYIL